LLLILPAALAAGSAAAQNLQLLPPLDEVLEAPAPIEVVGEPAPDYSWYQPAYYLSPKIWDGSIEVGVNGSRGNSQAFNISAGYNLKRETERFAFSSDLKYFNASTSGVQTQNYAIFNAGIEWKWDSPWSAFARTQLQYNEFQPWDLLLVLNGGLGYRVYDDGDNKLKLRAGAGASRQIGGADDEWKPEALFGVDSQLKVNDRQKFVSTIDYFPQWNNFDDYRLVSDVSWQVVLDEATNLSLKVGVVTNVDSTPQPGFVRSDVNYVALLLWKL
jgi:putative salt-induced outer membrane protein YdiY